MNKRGFIPWIGDIFLLFRLKATATFSSISNLVIVISMLSDSYSILNNHLVNFIM
jgi:hypothetical protein